MQAQVRAPFALTTKREPEIAAQLIESEPGPSRHSRARCSPADGVRRPHGLRACPSVRVETQYARPSYGLFPVVISTADGLQGLNGFWGR